MAEVSSQATEIPSERHDVPLLSFSRRDYVSHRPPGSQDGRRHPHARSGFRTRSDHRPGARPLAGRARAGGRGSVPAGHLRRPDRQAVRQARPGRGRRASCSTTASGSPATRSARSASSRSDPDLIAIPDASSLHAAAVRQPGPGARALRPARRGRAVALRPPGHPEAGDRWRGPPQQAAAVRWAPRSSTSWSTGPPTARWRPPTRATPPPRPCYDARGLTRMYEHLTAVSTAMNSLGWGNYANDHEDGNGQFEQNFAYADALTTADRVITAPVPDLGAGRAARHDRDLHAQAVHRPHRQRPAPAPVALARRRIPASPTPTTRADSASPRWPTRFLARNPRARAAALQAVLAPTVNSYKRTGAQLHPVRRHLVTAAGHLRRQRPHPLRARPRRQPHRAARWRRLGQPVPRRWPPRSPPGWTASSATSTRAPPVAAPSSARPGCRRPSCTPSRRSRPTRSSPPRSTRAGPGVSRYFAASSATEFFDWHGTVGSWELDRYLTAF